jgi:hypothetical protein
MADLDERRFGDRNSLCGLITAVYEFADTAYQQRIWIEAKGPEVSSYSEALSTLFYDYRIEEFAGGKAREFGFSEDAAKSLSHFAHVINSFHERLPIGLPDAEIIRLEAWTAVVAAAGRVLDSDALNWLAKNCDTFPMSPIDWRGQSFGGTWKDKKA